MGADSSVCEGLNFVARRCSGLTIYHTRWKLRKFVCICIFYHFERASGVWRWEALERIVKDEWENMKLRKTARTKDGERQKHRVTEDDNADGSNATHDVIPLSPHFSSSSSYFHFTLSLKNNAQSLEKTLRSLYGSTVSSSRSLRTIDV